MIRIISFSLLCIIAFHIYCLWIKRLQRVLQGIDPAKSKQNIGKRGTLVKDPFTGEYYVR